MLLHEVFDRRLIKLYPERPGKEAVFFDLIDAIADARPEIDREKMTAIILERERKLSTSVSSGAAIPHGYYPGLDKTVGAIGVSRAGILYDALDQEPVQVIFMIVMGEAAREKHLRVLSRILSLINSGALPGMAAAESPREIHEILSSFDQG
jgi:mannitol/fructose-specific phosphotransferase system IIA component (Ntr-type)